MFNIDYKALLDKTTNLTFKRGNDYYKEGRVKSVQFHQEKLTFDAKVLGTRSYDVKLAFGEDGKLRWSECSCPSHTTYWGYCKHTIAVLMLVKEKDSQGFFNHVITRKAAKQIFEFFQNRPNILKTPVELEFTYIFNNSYRNTVSNAGLSLRIGKDKLYIIRNIKTFFEKVERNEEIEFGKGFVFDPSRHCFKDTDIPIINFIKEIYQNEKLMDRLFSYNVSRTSLFKDKQVYLSDTASKRFFELTENRCFKAEIEDKTYESMSINKEDFPVKFLLSKDESELVLNIDFEGSLISLTDDGEYFFVADRIYKTSPKQQENFRPFYQAMNYQKSNKIRFIAEDTEKFISEILPFAEKLGSLTVSEHVENMIEKIPIDSEVYLDKSGDSVVADVRFKYGERIINPFAPQIPISSSSDKILLRDLEKERMILDILGESEFKVRNTQIYLDEEEDIFDFVFNSVPKLQEHTNIFYSEAFKRMTVRSLPSFSGRVRLNRDTDMLEFSFDINGIERSDLEKVFKGLREKKKYFRLKDGSYIPLDSKEMLELGNIIDYLGLNSRDFEKDFVEIPKYRALFLDQQIKEAHIQHLERDLYFKELVQNVREPSDMDFTIPEELKPVLRDYQKIGFKWLKTLSMYGLGGILADDMGLGKTLQVITLILSDKKERGSCPSLAVVPTSLVYNWCAEVEKFAPGLKVMAISGNKEERLKQIECIDGYDLVITSYPLIRRDIDDYLNFRFRFCILDEAQHIKNPASVNAKSVKQIRTEKRFALTGTPIENSLSELWSIFDFIIPGYLFSHSKFVQNYETPISKGEGEKELAELGRHIRPFILRRLKKDVLKELPEKIENRMVAELTDEQKKVYLAYLKEIKGEIEKEIEEKGFERSQIKILSGLTRLRQICCHPSLFLEDFDGESGKMQLFQEVVLDSIESGHRILLFSQFTSMLGIISRWLKKEGIEYMYLDGSTPAEQRSNLVKSFNEGQGKIFLISLKAGGTGLNLTGADMVIHYDPWWNPAVEEQATDRAYRIGQNKRVHVIKLVTKGTIEEKIYALQERKRQLVDSVIQPGETLISKLTVEEIRALFD